MQNKILIVSPIYPPEIGGPASYVPEVARRLSKLSKIKVVTFCSQQPQEIAGLDLVWVPLYRSALLRQLRLFWEILINCRFCEVIYAQGTVTVGLMSLLVAQITDKPLVIKFVGDEIWEQARNQTNPDDLEKFYAQKPNSLLIKLHRLVLRQAHFIVTPSQYLKKFLTTTHSLNPEKVRVIPNPIELPKIKQIVKNKRQLIYVGRLVAWKHVDQIIQALPALPKNWTLVIVGDGPLRDQLQKLVTKLKLNNRVKFTGSLGRVETLTLIASSQALVLASDYEGQSHVIIEAMQLGTPVIARAIEANRELVRDNGVLITDFLGKKFEKSVEQIVDITPPTAKYIKHHSWPNHLKLLRSVFNGL